MTNLQIERTERLTTGHGEVEVTYLAPHTDGEIHPRLRSKLIEREEISDLARYLKNRGNHVVYTSGVFDMIHVGHSRYLEVARSLGDVLFVGLNSDESVRALKGPTRPILGELQRAEMLSFLTSVDLINIYPERDGAEIIRLLKPDTYLCVDGSWEGELAEKPEVIAMAEHGGRVFCSPRQEPALSTTEIIRRIGKQMADEIVPKFIKVVQETFG